MTVTLKEVQQLKVTLEKLLLYMGHPRLKGHDFHIMQQINNLEMYKSSNEDYDGNVQISIMRAHINDCSPEVAEHINSFLANL